MDNQYLISPQSYYWTTAKDYCNNRGGYLVEITSANAVLDWYDDWVVRSNTWETRVPSVIILKDFMRRRRTPRFSKANVYIRDLYTCQYCKTPNTKSNLTLDHVMPISLGGKTNWTNIVAACGRCNSHKGNKLHMKPVCKPYMPDYYELVAKRKQLGFNVRHESWNAYLA